jgi:hypothetical protein
MAVVRDLFKNTEHPAVGLLVGGMPGQLLSNDAAERPERPMAIGLGVRLPEQGQWDAPGWLRWARGGTERARWCRMLDLLGGRCPGVRRSNPPASAAPVRRLWAATTKVHNAQLQVQSVCVFWQTLNKNVAALQDRGHVILFQPSASEVHAQAGKWFEDEEIYGWFASNLHRVREPSLRHYVRAKELKAAGMDWTEVLAEEVENRRARLVTEILASPAYDSTAARVAAFVQQGGGCRATFFNYRRSVGGRPRKALSSSADNRKL